MDQSDAYRVHVCDKCGLIAIADLKTMSFKCQSERCAQLLLLLLRAPRLALSLARARAACPPPFPPPSSLRAPGCNTSRVSQVLIPYACKLMVQELMAMQIAPRMMV